MGTVLLKPTLSEEIKKFLRVVKTLLTSDKVGFSRPVHVATFIYLFICLGTTADFELIRRMKV